MEWVEWIARFLSFWLDKVIYTFISTVYNLLTDIAQTSIFTSDVFELFASRVYALLGIFMLFKVSFSIFTYIVDPDSFLDKSKGFSKLISNILVTLALLLFVPWIFNQAMDIQRIILNDNIIGKFFSVNGLNENVTDDAGNVMAYETLKAFYHIDTNLYPECASGEDSPFENASNCENSLGLKDDEWNNLETILNNAYNSNSTSVYMDYDLLFLKGQDDNYVMYYIPIISTLAGGAIVLLLIVFCFDIAVRSVKIGFLRMLAPVPIISRIDPKKGKDMFDKWVKTCVNTYLDLFIRLMGIYFAVFVVTQIIDLQFEDMVTGQTADVNAFVKVFIILGALLFAKQLPKLIEEITGIKMDGKFTLNPMSKLRQTPLVGAGVTTAAALAGGAYTGYKAGVEAGHAGRGLWQGMMGAGREIRGKVPLMGDDKGKSPRALHTGMQAGYKTITGKDFTQYSIWKDFGKSAGEKEIGTKESPGLKQYKYALQGEQAKLDARLQTLYDQLTKATTEEEKLKLNTEIKDNRELYGKYTKNISALDDQIKDIKRLYNIDDSPKKDVDEAIATAKNILNENANRNSTQPSPIPPTHGPNGRGDPVPGQPNPNTSREKQQRRNNN